MAGSFGLAPGAGLRYLSPRHVLHRRECGAGDIGPLVGFRDRTALALLTLGAIIGPVLGVVLSLVAIAHASLGVAATLMSLSPVILLPLAHFLFGEKVGPRAVTGTVVALAGSAGLFWL